MSLCLVSPRDSYSALQLIACELEAAREGRPAGRSAAYALYDVAHSAVLYDASPEDVRRAAAHGCNFVPLGSEPLHGFTVLVAAPRLAQLFYDLTRQWANYAEWETSRLYVARFRIARVQTIGGGWASLRQADKALDCSMELYALAQIAGDGDIASKCRVFIGWAHLWSGHHDIAIHLFSLELKDAVQRRDIEHQRRCENAIINARTNPTLNGEAGPAGQFCLTDCWTNAFSGVDVFPAGQRQDD